MGFQATHFQKVVKYFWQFLGDVTNDVNEEMTFLKFLETLVFLKNAMSELRQMTFVYCFIYFSNDTKIMKICRPEETG